MFTRRAAALVSVSGVVGLSSPHAAGTQTAGRPPSVGVIHPNAPSEAGYAAFREGLAQLGYIEGQTILIEPRFAEGRLDLLRAFAAELVALRVDVIAVFGPAAVRAVRWATSAVPVVFAVIQDPVADGLMTDAGRPGGNVTGLTNFDPAQPRAQMRLLKEMLPGLARVAIFGDAGVPDLLDRTSIVAAEAEGLHPLSTRLKGASEDVEGLFAAAQEARAGAVLCLEAPITDLHSTRIAMMAIDWRMPTMFPGGWLSYGALLAYGSNRIETARRLAGLADRILKGSRPGDVAIEANTRHHLGINLTVARDIGVTIPPGVLARADQVIE
ncbi:ABC transporter substrate-binding protein [Humitalea sp. 24SJ18S-53]|uniref:ABC transporter substrate-binding protein n=1 Tax=Humitalea sp. 24SJ18S-53 TaxID=3422307 RepID=UPI003D6775AF